MGQWKVTHIYKSAAGQPNTKDGAAPWDSDTKSAIPNLEVLSCSLWICPQEKGTFISFPQEKTPSLAMGLLKSAMAFLLVQI